MLRERTAALRTPLVWLVLVECVVVGQDHTQVFGCVGPDTSLSGIRTHLILNLIYRAVDSESDVILLQCDTCTVNPPL